MKIKVEKSEEACGLHRSFAIFSSALFIFLILYFNFILNFKFHISNFAPNSIVWKLRHVLRQPYCVNSCCCSIIVCNAILFGNRVGFLLISIWSFKFCEFALSFLNFLDFLFCVACVTQFLFWKYLKYAYFLMEFWHIMRVCVCVYMQYFITKRQFWVQVLSIYVYTVYKYYIIR